MKRNLIPKIGNYFAIKCAAYLPDSIYLKLRFWYRVGYWPSFKNPKTYSEKLQWIKMNYRDPLYTTLVDKYAVKEYVSNIIGDKYIIPTLGVWSDAGEIDWEKLPNQFVLKVTHDSGGIVVCKNKECLDIKSAISKLNKALHTDYYKYSREWPYKNVNRKIIAEKYMEDSKTKELRDYKFFCFDGNVKALFIASDRMNLEEETKFDFFDSDFNHLPFRNGHPNAKIIPEKPIQFETMKKLASKLSEGIPQVRIDFYEVDGKVYFGEMTFFHWSGMKPFEPQIWDNTFGDWIQLPKEKIR